MSREHPKNEAWARYYANHPEVVAVWGEANGREPNCSCTPCDPEGLLPRPNILEPVEPTEDEEPAEPVLFEVYPTGVEGVSVQYLGEHEVLDAYQMSLEDRAEFDYLDWPALIEGLDSASFFRISNQAGEKTTYDLGEFSADFGITKGAGLPEHLAEWDGYLSESAFSAMVVKYIDNGDRVRVGQVIS